MLENPTPTAPDSTTVIKRYAPPNQRNRSLGRRKSGDRFDWTNNVYGNDSEKNQGTTSRNNNPVRDSGSSAILNEGLPRPALIPLEGCSRSDAYRLLSNRWAAAYRCHDTAVGLSERPDLYSGSSDSAWRNFRLPHQMMSPVNNTGPSSGSQMDFLVELHRAIRNANGNTDN